MIERTLTIINPTGLHARPAALFVKTLAQFRTTKIQVVKDGRTVDGRSLISLLTLGAGPGAQILVRAEGPDEQAALEALAEQVASGLGESAAG